VHFKHDKNGKEVEVSSEEVGDSDADSLDEEVLDSEEEE
jgi:hypothetical protein